MKLNDLIVTTVALGNWLNPLYRELLDLRETWLWNSLNVQSVTEKQTVLCLVSRNCLLTSYLFCTLLRLARGGFTSTRLHLGCLSLACYHVIAESGYVWLRRAVGIQDFRLFNYDCTLRNGGWNDLIEFWVVQLWCLLTCLIRQFPWIVNNWCAMDSPNTWSFALKFRELLLSYGKNPR